MADLRSLTRREREIVGRHAVRHGEVLGLPETVVDAEGGIGSPLVRMLTLARMERSGSITSGQRAAGDRFHDLFRRAALDGLKAADTSRVPSGPGSHADCDPSRKTRGR